MIFSSFEFIYLFLPIVFAGFLLLRRSAEILVIWWLLIASVVFYGMWNPMHLPLLLGSMAANYLLHRALLTWREPFLLYLGIAGNLAALGWFKYRDFFAESLGVAPAWGEIVLPLAISFFTFQQIAFLVDTWRGRHAETDFVRYALFVAFFPQLIAGPIVSNRETIPQFRAARFRSDVWRNLSVGLTLFAVGFFKKIVIADGLAPTADAVFGLAETGATPDAFAAWAGALAYTAQIYFDFSGYCDMALGAARCFGIRLPVNFNSPYKAVSIIDFWRRWHITLSRFLRDYLYIPLGGNRLGARRRSLNLAATMLLGGLWHGAGWTFIIWGALHGLFLGINHAWRAVRPVASGRVEIWAGRALTFAAVVVAWVFFRAESFAGAGRMLAGMVGFGDSTPLTDPGPGFAFAIAVLVLAMVAPNAIELTRRWRPALDTREHVGPRGRQWRPTVGWTAATACVAAIAAFQMYRLGDLSAFIYFNF